MLNGYSLKSGTISIVGGCRACISCSLLQPLAAPAGRWHKACFAHSFISSCETVHSQMNFKLDVFNFNIKIIFDISSFWIDCTKMISLICSVFSFSRFLTNFLVIPVQLSIGRGQTCALLDNSNRMNWRVKTQNGREGVAPGVCFVIPPPNSEAIELSHRFLSS